MKKSTLLLTSCGTALASLFATEFAIAGTPAPQPSGYYDHESQLFISGYTSQPAFTGEARLMDVDTTVKYSPFCRPTGANGDDDTTYQAPDGFQQDG